MGIGMSIKKKIPKKFSVWLKRRRRRKGSLKKRGVGEGGGVAEETACIFWVVVDNLGAGTV